MARSFLQGHQLLIGHVVNIWVVRIMRHLFTLLQGGLQQALFLELRRVLGLSHRCLQHLALPGAGLHIAHDHRHLHLPDDVCSRVNINLVYSTTVTVSTLSAVIGISTSCNLG